jgi:hypothetical protein
MVLGRLTGSPSQQMLFENVGFALIFPFGNVCGEEKKNELELEDIFIPRTIA